MRREHRSEGMAVVTGRGMQNARTGIHPGKEVLGWGTKCQRLLNHEWRFLQRGCCGVFMQPSCRGYTLSNSHSSQVWVRSVSGVMFRGRSFEWQRLLENRFSARDVVARENVVWTEVVLKVQCPGDNVRKAQKSLRRGSSEERQACAGSPSHQVVVWTRRKSSSQVAFDWIVDSLLAQTRARAAKLVRRPNT